MAIIFEDTGDPTGRILATVQATIVVSVATQLITAPDAFEVVRDQIAAILEAESTYQQGLAANANLNPNDWELKVYTERTNPFEEWLNVNNPDLEDNAPIVNVWWENTNFSESKGSTTECQQGDVSYNIDIYGRGVASDVDGGGHQAGDQLAIFNSQRGVRLVRNILMAAHNERLQLPGVVGKRWPTTVTTFQPQIDDNNTIQIQGSRIVLMVQMVENAPQIVGQAMEQINVQVNRTDGGQWVATTIDFTT